MTAASCSLDTARGWYGTSTIKAGWNSRGHGIVDLQEWEENEVKKGQRQVEKEVNANYFS